MGAPLAEPRENVRHAPDRERSYTGLPMKWLLRLFAVLYSFVALLFAGAALTLVARGARGLWDAIAGAGHSTTAVIESLGTLAVALVAIEITQTILEEEVIRRAQVSAPTRVRRYLSRFIVVVVVALAVKYLVAVVRYFDNQHEKLWSASSIGFTTAALLTAWGVFVYLNRFAEELEPEAMAEAKKEDAKVQ